MTASPHALVERVGRWTWGVSLYRDDGFTRYRCLRVWGSRARADRVAARALRRDRAAVQRRAGTRHRVEP